MMTLTNCTRGQMSMCFTAVRESNADEFSIGQIVKVVVKRVDVVGSTLVAGYMV